MQIVNHMPKGLDVTKAPSLIFNIEAISSKSSTTSGSSDSRDPKWLKANHCKKGIGVKHSGLLWVQEAEENDSEDDSNDNDDKEDGKDSTINMSEAMAKKENSRIATSLRSRNNNNNKNSTHKG